QGCEPDEGATARADTWTYPVPARGQAASMPHALERVDAPRRIDRVVREVPETPPSRVQRVVIDPGHGGSDPGAVGPTGLTESSVTLDVSRRLAERLATQYGVQVVLTRDADRYVPLEDRAAQANDAGADLFISVHCNSS